MVGRLGFATAASVIQISPPAPVEVKHSRCGHGYQQARIASSRRLAAAGDLGDLACAGARKPNSARDPHIGLA
jgi:hypothetical protein